MQFQYKEKTKIHARVIFLVERMTLCTLFLNTIVVFVYKWNALNFEYITDLFENGMMQLLPFDNTKKKKK